MLPSSAILVNVAQKQRRQRRETDYQSASIIQEDYPLFLCHYRQCLRRFQFQGQMVEIHGEFSSEHLLENPWKHIKIDFAENHLIDSDFDPAITDFGEFLLKANFIGPSGSR